MRVLFEWANDPLVRAMAFNQSPIKWERHLLWLQKKLTDPRCRLWIACDGGRPIGQIRFDRLDEQTAEIDVHTAPAERGRGYGPLMIREGTAALFADMDVQTIVAVVKQENGGSLAAFLKAGFEMTGSCFVQGVNCERLVLRRL